MKRQSYIVGVMCGLMSLSAVADSHSPRYQQLLEQAFASSIVLADSEVFTFGIHDFDPNEWFNLENENIGSEEATQLRQQIAVTTLPFTFELSPEGAINKHMLFTRLSAYVANQDINVKNDEPPDRSKEIIMDGYVAYRYQHQLTERWTLTPGVGIHFMYYRNKYEYNSDYTLNIKPFVDGIIVNTSAYAAVSEPHLKLKYLEKTRWGSWNAQSSAHYMYGRGWGEANHGHVGTPEGWYFSNGIEAFYDFNRSGKVIQSLYGSFRRIDVGGDTIEPLGARHYYETSVGWLITPPFDSDWIDNVGIGLNINYGSALKGGSIVLFFNQD